jgi:hypothetical protein
MKGEPVGLAVAAPERRGLQVGEQQRDPGVKVGQILDEITEVIAPGFEHQRVVLSRHVGHPEDPELFEDLLDGEALPLGKGLDQAVGDLIGVSLGGDKGVLLDACLPQDMPPLLAPPRRTTIASNALLTSPYIPLFSSARFQTAPP